MGADLGAFRFSPAQRLVIHHQHGGMPGVIIEHLVSLDHRCPTTSMQCADIDCPEVFDPVCKGCGAGLRATDLMALVWVEVPSTFPETENRHKLKSHGLIKLWSRWL